MPCGVSGGPNAAGTASRRPAKEVGALTLKPLKDNPPSTDAATDTTRSAVPGLPVADTVKRAPGGVVSETVERTDLYAVQTPQAFRARVFRDALAAWDGDATDCAGYVERSGGSVTVVQGDAALLKITDAGDLAAVERLLQGEAR